MGSFELRDVSFAVSAGGHALLTGPTASGKTTLLETIAGAVQPSRGSVLLGGEDVTRIATERRQLGFVHQHGYLFPHLNVRQNVAYGASHATVVDDLCRRFEIADLLGRAVPSLSGGERQIVALCRALAAEPCFVLLDEPFSALDGERRKRVIATFAVLQRERGMTVLHATHQADESLDLATTRLEMSGGALRQRIG